jgi:hypothetical protein
MYYSDFLVPPKTVKIRTVTPTFKTGGIGTLECASDASNPAAISTILYICLWNLQELPINVPNFFSSLDERR